MPLHTLSDYHDDDRDSRRKTYLDRDRDIQDDCYDHADRYGNKYCTLCSPTHNQLPLTNTLP